MSGEPPRPRRRPSGSYGPSAWGDVEPSGQGRARARRGAAALWRWLAPLRQRLVLLYRATPLPQRTAGELTRSLQPIGKPVLAATRAAGRAAGGGHLAGISAVLASVALMTVLILVVLQLTEPSHALQAPRALPTAR
jgi:hypothetical protein